ncbi:hypothetical protein L7F22_051776 [Adiantum nelumboides]|nr:hypothetical protein [Adiantum nelumboides]
MQMSNQAPKSSNIFLHDDFLNFLVVYNSQASCSWTTVVDMPYCGRFCNPFLDFTTTTNIHLGDVCAIRCHISEGLNGAYTADSDKWSTIDVQFPSNAFMDYNHVFKYSGVQWQSIPCSSTKLPEGFSPPLLLLYVQNGCFGLFFDFKHMCIQRTHSV